MILALARPGPVPARYPHPLLLPSWHPWPAPHARVMPAKAGTYATLRTITRGVVDSRLRGDDASPEEIARLDQCLRQGIHLGLGIIHAERGPARGRHAQPIHQRLGAMVARPHGHP